MANATTPASTVGFDIGGTKVLAAVVDAMGHVQAERREPSPELPADFVHLAGQIVADFRADDAPVSAVGCGSAGLIDTSGAVRFSPNMKGFVEVPLAAMLREALALPVAVDNDANVAALGEVVYGAARGACHVLVVTLGTGIGGGIVVNGEVYRGAHGYAAEIGHITVATEGTPCVCGEVGHWEAIASGSALGRLGRERALRGDAPSVLARAGGDAGAITGHDVGDAALAGHAVARQRPRPGNDRHRGWPGHVGRHVARPRARCVRATRRSSRPSRADLDCCRRSG
jgi:glucokinase